MKMGPVGSMPQIRHEKSEHGILVLKDKRARGFEYFTADVERYRRGIGLIIGHGFGEWLRERSVWLWNVSH
jgi:hypothetical protein